MVDTTKYYVDQYSIRSLIKAIAKSKKEMMDYIDASLFDQGKIYPTSITVTLGTVSGKTVPLTVTAKFASAITDDNNPYKSGAKKMRIVVNDEPQDIDYSEIAISGDTMTANIDYVASEYGDLKIKAQADTTKLNTIDSTESDVTLTPPR